MFQDAISSFLILYINFAYYCGVCPFRLKKSTSQYILHFWWPQKFICISNTILLFIWFSHEIRIIRWDQRKEPRVFFDIVWTACSQIFKVTTIFQFWTKASDLQNLVNFVEKSYPPRTNYGSTKVSPKTLAILLLLFSIFFALLSFTVESSEFSKGAFNLGNITQLPEGQWWWQGTIAFGKHYVFTPFICLFGNWTIGFLTAACIMSRYFQRVLYLPK